MSTTVTVALKTQTVPTNSNLSGFLKCSWWCNSVLMLSCLPCFLFRDMVRDFHRPSLCRLADFALPTPEPRSKLTFALPSDSSRDIKSFYRGHGETAVRFWPSNASRNNSVITPTFNFLHLDVPGWFCSIYYCLHVTCVQLRYFHFHSLRHKPGIYDFIFYIPCLQLLNTWARHRTRTCGTWRPLWKHSGSTWWAAPRPHILHHPTELSLHHLSFGGWKEGKGKLCQWEEASWGEWVTSCCTWRHILYSLLVSLCSSTIRWVYHPRRSPPYNP